MTNSKFCLGALQKRLFLLFFGLAFVGSWEEAEPWSKPAPKPSGGLSFTAATLAPPQIPHDTNVTEYNAQRRRRSSVLTSANTVDSVKILTSSHLSSLRDLISNKKITVRLGLHVSLSGPSEFLDPQHLLLLNKESVIYNTGEKSGLFSMRIVGLKKVT